MSELDDELSVWEFLLFIQIFFRSEFSLKIFFFFITQPMDELLRLLMMRLM